MMANWNQTVVDALALPVPPVLVSIMSQSGSVPRTAGARMLLDGNGTLFGTVGGGKYEARAIETARAMQITWQKHSGSMPEGYNGRILHSSLHGVTDMDMVCGGELRLLLEILPNSAELRESFAFAARAEAEGRAYTQITRIVFPGHGHSGKDDAVCRVTRHTMCDMPGVADCCLSLPAPVRDHMAHLRHTPVEMADPEDDRAVYLLEPFVAPFVLHIFGGGHVSKALAALAQPLDFRLHVLEDRPEFITPERFPTAEPHLLSCLGTAAAASYFAALELNERHGVVIMTRGHAHDRDVLAAALQTQAGYIGMIGSRSKWRQVCETLMGKGVAETSLGRVHTPIGFSIGADSPEEIAVSIAAELITWRSGKATRLG